MASIKGDVIMKTRSATILALLASIVLLTGSGSSDAAGVEMDTIRIYSAKTGEHTDFPVIKRSSEEWRKVLTAEQFYILRQEGTERPFTGRLLDNHRKGIYRCAGCGTDLFSYTTKYDSRTGWPSFWQPIDPGNIREVVDNSFFIRRVEIECARCGGHLGHVFNDGPQPTGLRFCINSASLTFVEGPVDGTRVN
jgi:peptide-methionine (R)-S-oxide reductase